MKTGTDQSWIWGHVVPGLAALASLFGTITPASAQTPPPPQQHVLHLQQRANRALETLRLANGPAEQSMLLDQRWMYEWNGSRWGHVAQTVYVYDRTDRTEEWEFVWNGAVMMNQSRTTYQLSAGHTLVELHEGFDPVTVTFYEMDRYTYEYLYDLFTGEPVFLHAVTYETKSGEEWLPVERTAYTQSSESELLGVANDWDGENWTPRDRFVMLETAQGVVQTEETHSGTEWMNSLRTTFPGFTIAGLREATDAFMEQFLEYAGLNLAAHLDPNYSSEAWNGIDWLPSERKTWLVMDPDVGSGLSFTGAVYESWDDGWIPEHRQVTTHRMVDQKPIRTTLAVPNGDTWQTTLVETFEYDARGDMNRATQEVDHGEGMENSLQFVFLWAPPSLGIEDEETPAAFALNSAYPNPFNPATSIPYRLASPGSLSIRAYDTLGRQVATLFEGSQVSGTHEVRFDAQDLPSGTYLIRLDAPSVSQTRTVTLLK